MINWLNKKGENEEVSSAILSLSKFYKMTLSKGNIVVTIAEDRIKDILAGKVQSSTGSGVGIVNTHNRLQLFYDSQFGLSYRSKLGEYTEIEIRIPAVKA